MHPHIHLLSPVELGGAASAEAHRSGAAPLLLNSNEDPYGPFPEAIEIAASGAAALHRYADPSSSALRESLAGRLGVDAAQILIDGGSLRLISLIIEAVSGPEDEVLIPWPSWPVYKLLGMRVGARMVMAPLRDHTVDFDALLGLITARTRLIIVPNPNNPTGTAVSRAALDDFVRRVPDTITVIFDEAYAEYSPDHADVFQYLESRPTMIVTRTFSKVFALAAARVGYAVAAPATIEGLRRFLPPYPVSHLSAEMARVSWENRSEIERRVRRNAAAREQLYDGFKRLGLCWLPSLTNFIKLDVRHDGDRVYEGLARHGVLTRSGKPYAHPTGIRVTVGTPEENSKFLQALEDVLEELDGRERPRAGGR